MDSENTDTCWCKSGKPYQACCKVFIELNELPTTAEQLMRSRYTAYALEKAGYIVDTSHPRVRHLYSKRSILQWARENEWIGLEIVNSDEFTVEFKAYFKDIENQVNCHHEFSTFEKLGSKWYYVSGEYIE